MDKKNLQLISVTYSDDDILGYVKAHNTPEVREALLRTPTLQGFYCSSICTASILMEGNDDNGCSLFSSMDQCILLPDYKCLDGRMAHKITGFAPQGMAALESIKKHGGEDD